MKITNLSLPFILLSIYSISFIAIAAEEPSPVLDIDGKNLRTGVEYYILPFVRGRGGGLTMDSPRNGTCPLNVVQEQQEVDRGLPITFTPVNPKKGVIRVLTDLNVKFSAITICIESNVWKLADYDQLTGQYFIETNGVEGNPGRETISNWFRIEEEGSVYKLVFCPSVCAECRVICRAVGIFIQDGVRRLALSDVPFRVFFKKVSETGNTSD